MYGGNGGNGGGAIAAGAALPTISYSVTGPLMLGIATVLAALVVLRGRRLSTRAF